MFLAFEIMEEASLRQPGGLADLVHRSGCVAFDQHQLLGGVEQLLFGQRIALGYVHGAYLPVGMTLSRASSGVKPVFRESTAECCEYRIRPVTWSVLEDQQSRDRRDAVVGGEFLCPRSP